MRSILTSGSGFSGKVTLEEKNDSIDGLYSLDIKNQNYPILSVIIQVSENENRFFSLWSATLSEDLIKTHVCKT